MGHIVINRRTPTPAEVLGPNANLQSLEEREGGRTLNGAEAESLQSMLWDLADRAKRQRKRVQEEYSTRRGKRGDYSYDWGSLTERISNPPNRNDRPNRKYRERKRACTSVVVDDRFSKATTPARYEPAEPAGPSYPLESKRDGMYGDEGEGYEEEEVPADQEMVEGDKPVKGKGKAVDCT